MKQQTSQKLYSANRAMNGDNIVHINPESILIVDRKGALKRLKCPFKVLLMVRIDDLQEGQYYMVRLVVPDTRFEMVYMIQGQGTYYPFYCFAIM